MKTYSLQEAIQAVPSIGATRGGDNTSGKYQFVSTRNILENVISNGWNITRRSVLTEEVCLRLGSEQEAILPMRRVHRTNR